MQKADYWLRLMKQRTDALVVSDKKLQQFLMWVSQKSLSVKVPYKPAAVRAFYFALDRALAPELKRILQALKEQLPDPDSDWEIFKQWWKANGKAWTEQLRAVMIKHRNIGHDWQFSKEQRELLKQYYHANKLLIDCLNNASNVTPAVRSHIEETLLLPIAEIENHR